jgi:hypothetical protein
MKPHERHLRVALAASHEVAGRLDGAACPLAELETLQNWQRERLAATYADLMNEEQYRAAGHFFLEQLYGGLDFRDRDREVEHVLPVMARMLPDHMLESMADAFDLQALSLDLDLDMAARMAAQNRQALDLESYGTLYRETGRKDERQRQVELISELGLELNELVRHRMVLRLVRLLRVPARAAGFGQLQGFLEEGLFAFRAMRDGQAFVQAISDRETEIMLRLQRGERAPFNLEDIPA